MNELHKLLTLKKTLETDLKKPHFNKDSVLLNMYNMRNLIIINKQLLNFSKEDIEKAKKDLGIE
jgi:hypothetical protein